MFVYNKWQEKKLSHNISVGIITTNQSLVLQRVSRHSAGRYRCSATNREGETESDVFHLNVKCKPLWFVCLFVSFLSLFIYFFFLLFGFLSSQSCQSFAFYVFDLRWSRISRFQSRVDLILLLYDNRFILSGAKNASNRDTEDGGAGHCLYPFFSGVIVRFSLDSASIVRSFALDHWHISKAMLYKLCKLRLHSR